MLIVVIVDNVVTVGNKTVTDTNNRKKGVCLIGAKAIGQNPICRKSELPHSIKIQQLVEVLIEALKYEQLTNDNMSIIS